MNNRFRVRKIVRLGVTFAAIVVCLGLAATILRIFQEDARHELFANLLIMIACTIVLAYCAVSFSKAEYEITADELIAKDFFSKNWR